MITVYFAIFLDSTFKRLTTPCVQLKMVCRFRSEALVKNIIIPLARYANSVGRGEGEGGRSEGRTEEGGERGKCRFKLSFKLLCVTSSCTKLFTDIMLSFSQNLSHTLELVTAWH